MESRHVSFMQWFGGSILAAVSHLDLPTTSYIVGIIAAIVGVVGGLYWQWKRDKREKLIAEVTLASIKSKGIHIGDANAELE